MKSKPFIITLLFLILFLGFNSTIQAGIQNTEKPVKIGLALGGGGARGGAHIGVIRELEAMGIQIDCIAGTSIGAVIGALYASGYSPDDIEQLIREVDWNTVIQDSLPRHDLSFQRKADDEIYLIESKPGIKSDGLHLPAGINSGQQALLLLKSLYAKYPYEFSFDEMDIPFRAISTDLTTGQPYVIKYGDLANSVLASMSIPGAFAPVDYQGRLLVDGGVSNNLPVAAVRELCADIVIAVDIGTPMLKKDEIDSILSVSSQLTNIMTQQNTQRSIQSLTENDILIAPKNITVETLELNKTLEAVNTGLLATQKKRKQLSLLPHDLNRQKTPSVKEKTAPQVVIDHIKIINSSSISLNYINTLISIKEGDTVDEKQLEASVDLFVGMGFFSTVKYFMTREQQQTTLTYEFTQKPWGPTFLRLGAGILNSSRTHPKYAFALGYQKIPFTQHGGEFLTGIQFGSTIAFATRVFLPLPNKPEVSLIADNIYLWDNEDEETTIRNWEGSIQAAYTPTNNSRYKTGIHYSGTSLPDSLHTNKSPNHFAFTANFTRDTLDDLNFPTQGSKLLLTYFNSSRNFGSDYDYDLFKGSWLKANSRGKLVLETMFEFQLGNINNLPPQKHAKLGGFRHLSGYEYGSLNGGSSWLLSTTFQRDLTSITSIGYKIIMSAGISLEAGNVSESTSDFTFDNPKKSATFFFGLKTGFGPLYLGLGLSEDDVLGYFLLGKTF